MPKRMVSFRLEEQAIEFLDEFAAHHEISRAKLVEDALANVRVLAHAGQRNHRSLTRALTERYGSEAVVSATVSSDGRVLVLIDGREQEGLSGRSVIDHEGWVSIFLELDGSGTAEELGPVRVGAMMLSHPIQAFARLPWPLPDPRLGVVFQLGLGENVDRGTAVVELDEVTP